jgi:hypothetical protein
MKRHTHRWCLYLAAMFTVFSWLVAFDQVLP